MVDSNFSGLPQKQGLYDPSFEHDACGIGMLVNVQGVKSHKLIEDAIEVLKNLTHRGGVGSEPETGDGAGILLQIPHDFMRRVMADEGVELPREGEYGIAMMFASPDRDRCDATAAAFCGIAEREGLGVLGTRVVPVYPECVGKTACEVRPGIRQVFIARPEGASEDDFERALYIVSKLAHSEIRMAQTEPDLYFYLSSISCRTIVYKGMLLPSQMASFYPDLRDTELVSAIALVHSRFSTNTFPSWERAHPMRRLVHNGEINTIRGNVNWVKAREAGLESKVFGDNFRKILPVINETGSDSAMLDDFLALLVHAGRSLPEAFMITIPEPWKDRDDMDDERKAFCEYVNCLLEPWDGPAAIAFTDGRVAGAMLDRNGLRPARYCLTKDGLLILSSEAGVLPVTPSEVLKKDRLRPGRMLLIDTVQKRIIEDGELKSKAAAAKPYRRWLEKNLTELDKLPAGKKQGATWQDVIRSRKRRGEGEPREQALMKNLVGLEFLMAGRDNAAKDLPLMTVQKIFGYTWEDLNLTLKTVADTAEDPISSMGTDSPPAVLSNRPQLLYNYFKQLFAQVTNPPIDAIREHIVTSSDIQLGSEGNLLEPTSVNCRMIRHSTPILTEEELAKLRSVNLRGLSSVTLPILFSAREKHGLERALDDLFLAADTAMADGYNIIILSDRGVSEYRLPIPALLAAAGLHHHLIRNGNRTRISIVADTGEAREAHHLALLVGFGANAVCPYLAYRSLDKMAEEGRLGADAERAKYNYRKAMSDAIVKIMSKMGVSTVRSYHGAQIFEALGVSEAVVDKYFTGAITRIGGVTLREIERESVRRHAQAFDPVTKNEALDPGGDYKWRKNGEYHLFNPENIFYLQQSCRTGNYEMFKKFSSCVNNRTKELKNIRGLLDVVTAEKPLPLDAVEAEESIVKRFKTGAMSYGSISRDAHECMAIAMNRLGGRSNTGEGGEIPERFVRDADGANRSSAVKQVASGRFGVNIHYLNNATELQIKMAQGAKPGEGGHLPGNKVYPQIAKSRHSTPGVGLISPPPHHDIYSIEDLAQLIRDLKSANRDARVSVKLVSEAGVGTVAVGVAKGLADVIVVSGYEGGTGAAPRTSIRHAGLPWELGVAEAHQSLLMNNMRNRVVLETDGKLLTGRDIIVAALLGAEEFAFATAPLVVLGCDMMRVCNLDTCPVGIATQNPDLCKRFAGKPEYIENLMRFLAREVREWMARLGVRRFDELVGHVELLRQINDAGGDKAKTVDLSGLLYQPKAVDNAGARYFTHPQDHALGRTVDQNTLLRLCGPAIEKKGGRARYSLPVNNRNRTIGCMLSSEIVRRHGADGLPDASVKLRFEGSAGQSFGAFLAKGVELTLCGESNDHVGKGLSGGRIIVIPPADSPFDPAENIIIGNVALYGATAGEAYICGVAGERFCVRNSGAIAVAEGVGDHGCEYMTGGCVVILGRTGRNFAAGMSGGVAYVFDPEDELIRNCNREGLIIDVPGKNDRDELKQLIKAHLAYTGSAAAKAVLGDFTASCRSFKKIIPAGYSRMLIALDEARRRKLSGDDLMLYAFEKVVGGSEHSEERRP